MVDPLTRTVRPFKWKRTRKPLSQEIHSTYRTLVFAILFLGLTSSGTYLYMNSLAPAKGYELKQLQIDYELLQSDLRKLDRKVVDAKSFINLEKSAALRKMRIAESSELSFVEGGNVAENAIVPSNTHD